MFQGTVSVVSCHPTMTMPYLQQYPWSLNLIKIVEDNFIFWHEKMLNPDSFSNLFLQARNVQVNFASVKCSKTKTKHEVYNYWSDKAFKGTVVYRA